MSKYRPRKPTKQDFEEFRAEFLRCVRILILDDWRITFEFKPIDDSFAEITIDSQGFSAWVTFNSKVMDKDQLSSYNPKRTARHEVSHLFHARLKYIGRCRFVRPDDFDEEDERLCRVMETLLEIKT